MLTVLEGWVERGTAPAQVVATRATAGKVERTRPLCPHPQVAQYLGQGDVNSAENFRCQAPSAR
jgi:feruloyl esterase